MMDPSQQDSDANRDGVTTDGGSDVVREGREARTTEVGDGDALPERLREEEHREFLMEAVRRAPMLAELRWGSATASELVDAVDLSRSTVHRATNSLEELDLIEKTDGAFELTSLGKIVAEETQQFGSRMSAAAALEPFLNAIDTDDVPIEHFVGAKITRPEPRQPHASIQRIIDLIEASERLRMLSTVISPIYVDVGYREMMSGMQIEAVFETQAVEIMVSEYEQKARETIGTGNFEVYMKDELPFELFLFEDKVGMAAHDENGIAQLVAETDSQAAMSWAEELYEEHAAAASPLHLQE